MSTFLIVALSVVGTLATLFLLCFIGVLVLRRRHTSEVDENLSKMKGALGAMQEGLHFFWCHLLIYFWKGRFYLRKFVPWVVFGIFVFAGISAVAEGVGKLAGWAAQFRVTQGVASPTAATIARILAKVRDWLGALYERPTLLLILLVCEILIIWHHVREHRHRDRERKTVDNILDLFHPLNKVCVYLNLADKATIDEEARRTAKTEAVETFLKHFSKKVREIFEERGVKDLNVCVMLVEPKTGDLVADFESSGGRDFRKGYRLVKGKGAAGRSVEKNQTIYVPNVKYEHAVSVTDHVNKVLSNVYSKGGSHFESMICTPIAVQTGIETGGEVVAPGRPSEGEGEASSTPHHASKIIGVLSVASPRTSPFSEFDFTVIRLGARVLELMYNQEFNKERGLYAEL